MRRALFLAAALALAGCGKQNEPGNVATFAGEWITIAHTTDRGDVQFLPRSVARDSAQGTTDITLRITYPNLQTWVADLPAYTETTTFPVELVTVRFDCAAHSYAVVQREALDRAGAVREAVRPTVPGKTGFKAIVPGGLMEIAYPRACPK